MGDLKKRYECLKVLFNIFSLKFVHKRLKSFCVAEQNSFLYGGFGAKMNIENKQYVISLV